MTSMGIERRVPRPTDQSDIVSWVHFGDLHMTTPPEQNYRDFVSLIEEVNRVMADSLNFAYLPGDNADHGGTDDSCAKGWTNSICPGSPSWEITMFIRKITTISSAS